MDCRYIRSICLTFALLFFSGVPTVFGFTESSGYFHSITSEEREAEEKTSEGDETLTERKTESNLTAGAGADQHQSSVATLCSSFAQLFLAFPAIVSCSTPANTSCHLPHSHGPALLAYLATWRK